jgi:hypothetical protein
MGCVPELTRIENAPELSVVVPLPAAVIEAPESPFPVSSRTVPVTVPLCALENSTDRENNRKMLVLLMTVTELIILVFDG